MLKSDFKKRFNAELKMARIDNPVTKVIEKAGTFHTILVFTKTLTKAQQDFMVIRFKNVDIDDKFLTIKHPVQK
jgi:hypothetical protein